MPDFCWRLSELIGRELLFSGRHAFYMITESFIGSEIERHMISSKAVTCIMNWQNGSSPCGSSETACSLSLGVRLMLESVQQRVLREPKASKSRGHRQLLLDQKISA